MNTTPRPTHQHRGGGTSTERAYWRRNDPQNLRTARTLRDLTFTPTDWLSGPYSREDTARAARRARRFLAFAFAVGVLLILASYIGSRP